jgi:hypothetical protein
MTMRYSIDCGLRKPDTRKFSCWNLADFAVFPDDHEQATLPKFDALFSGGATMGAQGDACPF